jgi:hypothetical protein
MTEGSLVHERQTLYKGREVAVCEFSAQFPDIVRRDFFAFRESMSIEAGKKSQRPRVQPPRLSDLCVLA